MRWQDYAQLLYDTFVHQQKAYTEQWYTPEKGVGYLMAMEGACRHDPPCKRKSQCSDMSTLPITVDVIKQHLKGEKTLGIYQLGDDNTVKWACIDVDIRKRAGGDEDELTNAVKAQTTALARATHNVIGNRFAVENSGGRGYHLWIFFKTPVQARHALALLEYIVHKTPSVDDRISMELFPKQTAMKSFGNLVKMPLGVHRKTNARCLFVDNRFTPYADQYEKLSTTRRMTESELLFLLEKHHMDVAVSIRIEPVGDSKARTTLPCQMRMMREGLGEGTRDIGMFKVGCFMRDRGVPFDMALTAMSEMNGRNKPPLDEYVVEMKAESAYHGDYTATCCNAPDLDSYCSSSCRFWDTKVQERWTRFNRDPKDAVGKISRD